MIHAYDEDCVNNIQDIVGSMFEIAVLFDNLDIDYFGNKFIESEISKYLEINYCKYSLGKSGIELYSEIMDKEPKQIIQPFEATKEYWVGYVLAYIQWYYNKSFKEIINAFPCSELIKKYNPYHEMDIMHMVDFYKQVLDIRSKLKIFREKLNMSQSELANVSNVSIRAIRAYEQGKLDISKASGETLYKLSKALGCKMEDLIL